MFTPVVYCSTEETLGIVSNNEPEAVSIGNKDINLSEPDEIPQVVLSVPDEISPPSALDEIPKYQDDVPENLVKV